MWLTSPGVVGGLAAGDVLGGVALAEVVGAFAGAALGESTSPEAELVGVLAGGEACGTTTWRLAQPS